MRLQQFLGGAAGAFGDGVDGGHQVLEKQPEVALILVEGQPRDRMFAVLGPLGDEHALAVAGGCRNQGQGHLEGPVHQPEEPIPAHHIERHRRSVQLGADQGRGALLRFQEFLQSVRTYQCSLASSRDHNRKQGGDKLRPHAGRVLKCLQGGYPPLAGLIRRRRRSTSARDGRWFYVWHTVDEPRRVGHSRYSRLLEHQQESNHEAVRPALDIETVEPDVAIVDTHRAPGGRPPVHAE